MPASIEFTPEQIAKARRYCDSIRDEDYDFQLRDDLDAELGENLDSLLELIENEPIPRSAAWTPALVKQAQRICQLRPLTDPSNAGAKEATAEFQKLRSELRSSLGVRSSSELQDWCQQQEKRRAELQTELGEDLVGFYELLIGRGEMTVWELCGISKLSQPSVWRRLKTLEQRGLVKELPPLQARWAVIGE
jgi:uncharacterized membrane protein